MVRCKYRYLAVAIDVLDSPPHAPFTVSQSQLYSSITNVVEKIHGDFGVASITTGFKVKYCNPYTKIILIRCRHGPHRFVSTVLPIIRTIGKTKVQLNIIYIGSTIMKSYKYIRVCIIILYFFT